MRLLIDEDTQAHSLVELLRAAEHDVTTAQAAGLNGKRDEEILSFAFMDNRVILTRNCSDFLELIHSGAAHAGILLIYQDSQVSKCMSYGDIVRAIARIEVADLEFHKTPQALNQWR